MKSERSEPRLAFILDALPSLGGAEKVLFTALEIYPQADVFTLIYHRKFFGETPLAQRNIRTSYLDTFPLAHKYHRFFLPLMPRAIESFDLCSYDAIVSFNYAVAHGVRNSNNVPQLAYTYTPMRYAWTDLNLNGTHTRKNILVNTLINAFRKWDLEAAERVHEFAAISQAVVERIHSAWRREARLIYPPVETERFHPQSQRENFYITVSRLVPHKRIDLLVQAFSKTGLPLLVVGDGPERAHLQSMAGPKVEFLGYQPDSKIDELLSTARGFVCAAEEDFGIAIVEAQAAGCPVIAYGSGGALESVIENCTGLFFAEQSVQSVLDAIQRFEKHYSCFPTEEIVQNAKRFGKHRFLGEFKQFVDSHL
jgi:glycosyltransferase involved in cell wall biosynthesis